MYQEVSNQLTVDTTQEGSWYDQTERQQIGRHERHQDGCQVCTQHTWQWVHPDQGAGAGTRT